MHTKVLHFLQDHTLKKKKKNIASEHNPGNNYVSSKIYLAKQMKCDFWKTGLFFASYENVQFDYKLCFIVETR